MLVNFRQKAKEGNGDCEATTCTETQNAQDALLARLQNQDFQ